MFHSRHLNMINYNVKYLRFLSLSRYLITRIRYSGTTAAELFQCKAEVRVQQNCRQLECLTLMIFLFQSKLMSINLHSDRKDVTHFLRARIYSNVREYERLQDSGKFAKYVNSSQAPRSYYV